GIEVSGVIKPAIDMAANLRPQDLGLIGGRRTVVSGVYRRGLAAEGIALKQRIAQPLSGLIEKGEIDSPVLHIESQRILKPLAKCTHILLACTHYPAITSVLSRYVSPTTQLIDPADAVVSRLDLSRTLTDQPDIFLTTGSTKEMRQAAKAAWAVDLKGPRQVRGL
ncbi:MAG: aspartate/glutamate racemase family protein, partial [Acidobacteria bacterium]|nr:aspartate/glutamate racemase family protein [Acidobacteriota bacterium]